MRLFNNLEKIKLFTTWKQLRRSANALTEATPRILKRQRHCLREVAGGTPRTSSTTARH